MNKNNNRKNNKQKYDNERVDDVKSINSVGSIKEKNYDTITFRIGFIKDLLNGIALKKQDLENKEQIPDSNLFLVFSKDKFIGIYEKISEIEAKEKRDEIKDENEIGDGDKIAKSKFVLN